MTISQAACNSIYQVSNAAEHLRIFGKALLPLSENRVHRSAHRGLLAQDMGAPPIAHGTYIELAQNSDSETEAESPEQPSSKRTTINFKDLTLPNERWSSLPNQRGQGFSQHQDHSRGHGRSDSTGSVFSHRRSDSTGTPLFRKSFATLPPPATMILDGQNTFDRIQDDVTSSDPGSLARQALPSLIISVGGLIFAGWLLDIVQHWDVFTKTTELFILVPVLLNLKGNLEMNLAARLSTSANLGDLDFAPTRRAMIVGNLSLLQVQATVVGSIAGLFSFLLGVIMEPKNIGGFSEVMLMISSAMICAAVSGFVLGVFMCALVIASRWANINPDNIACPLASSLGDVVTLVFLAVVANALAANMESFLSELLFVLMAVSLPFFGRVVYRNKFVKDLLWQGWTPILLAMLISSMAGLVLERYVEQYAGLAMLTPILCGLAGNFGSIYASRISTSLHANLEEDYHRVQWTLLLMNIPIQVIFLFIIWLLDLGHIRYTLVFVTGYFTVSMVCTWAALSMGKHGTLHFWRKGYDPDNYVLPY
ncbi:hypothetical protein BZG36_04832, partial [Bifiguratus adelaidae]